MLLGPSSCSTIFDDKLSLHQFSSSYHFTLNRKLDFEFVLYPCSNNLPFHHSFDLLSSLIDYIFKKTFDKCVVIILNVMRSSMISIDFPMRNTILTPRWFVLPSTTPLPFFHHKLVLLLMQPAIQLALYSTLKYYYLLCQGCCETCSTS